MRRMLSEAKTTILVRAGDKPLQQTSLRTSTWARCEAFEISPWDDRRGIAESPRIGLLIRFRVLSLVGLTWTALDCSIGTNIWSEFEADGRGREGPQFQQAGYFSGLLSEACTKSAGFAVRAART
jgi:hypothetical protein